MIISIPLPFEVLTVWLVIFKGSIFHKFALISQYQGSNFHKFLLWPILAKYIKVLYFMNFRIRNINPLKISNYKVLHLELVKGQYDP